MDGAVDRDGNRMTIDERVCLSAYGNSRFRCVKGISRMRIEGFRILSSCVFVLSEVFLFYYRRAARIQRLDCCDKRMAASQLR
ncbi:hypothetical protein CONLIGDRAFT_470587 [Coniochaeta ligniaria NRRL 30616]|uniref:Uncharacterized protein n=1 Tax=Coniochaeta ligniaria NRRL 30616 TaxID=1408157 RepID=A0A1J7JFK7_9PEZI|nr:hypothetical protein CONLIGDRAFT_470587 [Coniochaeta ligniaria NRRL 30616]